MSKAPINIRGISVIPNYTFSVSDYTITNQYGTLNVVPMPQLEYQPKHRAPVGTEKAFPSLGKHIKQYKEYDWYEGETKDLIDVKSHGGQLNKVKIRKKAPFIYKMSS